MYRLKIEQTRSSYSCKISTNFRPRLKKLTFSSRLFWKPSQPILTIVIRKWYVGQIWIFVFFFIKTYSSEFWESFRANISTRLFYSLNRLVFYSCRRLDSTISRVTYLEIFGFEQKLGFATTLRIVLHIKRTKYKYHVRLVLNYETRGADSKNITRILTLKNISTSGNAISCHRYYKREPLGNHNQMFVYRRVKYLKAWNVRISNATRRLKEKLGLHGLGKIWKAWKLNGYLHLK